MDRYPLPSWCAGWLPSTMERKVVDMVVDITARRRARPRRWEGALTSVENLPPTCTDTRFMIRGLCLKAR